MGSFAVGFTSPKRMLGDGVGPLAAGVPGFEDAADAVDPGMVTAVPVSRTTMVFGLAAATAAMSLSWLSSRGEGGKVHAFARPLVGEDDGDVGVLGEGGCGGDVIA